MASGAADGGADSIAALKRIKAAEGEWDTKVAAAKKAAEESLARRRTEVEAALQAARRQADAERTKAVEAARAQAEGEAARIVAEGVATAQKAAQGAKPSERRADVLRAVLGDLRGE